MNKLIARSMLTMCFLFGMIGCRTNYIHAYKESVYELGDGAFVFKMQGTIEDRTENGKKIRVLADPYSLVVRFLSNHEGWDRVKLDDVRLVSSQGEEVFSESLIEKPVAGTDLEGRRFVGFSFGGLKIPYRNYNVFGSFEILDSSGNVLESGEFKVVLEKDYRETKSNDLIDGAMGV